MRKLWIVLAAAACGAVFLSGAQGREPEETGPTFRSYVEQFIDIFWCRVDDPAVAACKGKVSRKAVRRCVSTKIPPPTELQKPIPVIKRLFENCESRLEREGEEAVKPYLDSTLLIIEAEHGRASVPYANALTQIIVRLSGPSDRFAFLHPYSEAAVSVTREVYGTDHRETAIVLHTHADILIGQNNGKYTEAAVPLLREAAGIRRRVLGADHEETLAAEARLAEMLFTKWQQAEDRQSRMHLLDEAEALTERAAAALRKPQDGLGLERMAAEALLGRIAFARKEYEKAVAHFEAAFEKNNDFTAVVGCSLVEDACRDYIEALRKLGREEEAERIEEKLERFSVSVTTKSED